MFRKRNYSLIGIITTLFIASVILGVINDITKRKLLDVQNDKINSYISLIIENVSIQFSLNGSRVNYLPAFNDLGISCSLTEALSNDSLLVFYYDLNMCSSCYEKALAILEKLPSSDKSNIIILSAQDNHRTFSYKMEKQGFTRFISIKPGMMPIQTSVSLKKPVFFICQDKRIQNAFSFDSNLPEKLLIAYLSKTIGVTFTTNKN